MRDTILISHECGGLMLGSSCQAGDRSTGPALPREHWSPDYAAQWLQLPQASEYCHLQRYVAQEKRTRQVWQLPIGNVLENAVLKEEKGHLSK